MAEAKETATRRFLGVIDSNLKRIFTRKRADFVAGFLVVVFAVMWITGLVDQVIMPLVVRSGAEIEIPDLRGKHIKAVEHICDERKLQLERLERMRIDNNNPPGTVLDQYPEPGFISKPGRKVEVLISVREGMIRCPNVVGKSSIEAMLIADSTGLFLSEEYYRYHHSDRYPEGVIIYQDPSSLTPVNRGDTLAITISLGPEPEKLIVPDVTGNSLTEAKLMLAKYSLRIGTITRFPTRTSPAGTIIGQEPEPNTPAIEGMRVNLRIAVTTKNN